MYIDGTNIISQSKMYTDHLLVGMDVNEIMKIGNLSVDMGRIKQNHSR